MNTLLSNDKIVSISWIKKSMAVVRVVLAKFKILQATKYIFLRAVEVSNTIGNRKVS